MAQLKIEDNKNNLSIHLFVKMMRLSCIVTLILTSKLSMGSE